MIEPQQATRLSAAHFAEEYDCEPTLWDYREVFDFSRLAWGRPKKIIESACERWRRPSTKGDVSYEGIVEDIEGKTSTTKSVPFCLCRQSPMPVSSRGATRLERSRGCPGPGLGQTEVI